MQTGTQYVSVQRDIPEETISLTGSRSIIGKTVVGILEAGTFVCGVVQRVI